MAAPVATVRGTPTGIKLVDGFPSKITFALLPNVELWEKSVKPPGIDGGDGIPQTTMLNTKWHTFAPRKLLKLTDATAKCAYDPSCYQSLLSIININTTVTVTFGDGSTLAFFGFLKMFDVSELAEGAQPEATVTIFPTNFDPVNRTEEPPVLTSVPGT